MNFKEIGTRIKARRKSLNLTQAELASMIGLTESSVSRYESGKISTMPTATIVKICKALNMDSAELLGLDTSSFEYDLTQILKLCDDLPLNVKSDLLSGLKSQIMLIRKWTYEKDCNVFAKIKK